MIFTFVLGVLLAGPAHAARTVDSATVDGSTSTSVAAGATISAAVTVTTTGNGSNNDWQSTGWLIAGSGGSLNCIDHPDHTSAGTETETFDITAPGANGTYNVYLVAYQNDNCTGGPSTEFVLTNGVTIGAPGTTCDTFRDEFSSESYSRQDGTRYWTADWEEVGDNDAASNGDIEISGGRLQLEGDGSASTSLGGPYVQREANLSAYSSATLTFDFAETGNWEGNDDIEVYVSADGGGSWTLIHTFSNDQGDTPQQFSQDISGYISGNTRIALVEKADAADEIFYFDNVQIEACSAGIPTVDSQTTSDTTPVLTGTFNSAGSAGGFSVTVNSVTYALGIDGELTSSGDNWTLDLSSATPLAVGVYDVVAASDDGAGNVQTDNTVDELTIVVCFTDDFNRAALGSDWLVSNSNGSFGDPQIVNNRLRLTDATNNVSTATTLLRLFPGANNKIIYEFDLYDYDGSGADGVAVTLSDSAISPIPGGYGGSLGYAQRCGIDGFAGGWLGIGFDEYGNFSNPTECRDGGPGFRVDAVAIRGSGAGLTGYPYLAGTGTLSPGIDQSGSTPGPGDRYRVTVDHTSGSMADVTVERDTGSGYQTLVNTFDVFTVNPSQDAVPTYWLMSLTGSTGGSTNIHEIDNLQVCANSILPYNSIDHYRFYHDGSGLTCSPENIQIRACLDSTCSSEYSGVVSATFGPSGWVGGDTQSFTSGDALQLWYTTAGTASLQISGSSPDFTAANPPRCFIGATEQPDCNLEFFDSGFTFDVPDHISDQQQTVTIAAVRKDPTSEQCVPGFQNVSKDIRFWSGYLNPLSGSRSVLVDGVAITGSSPGSTRTLNFDGTGEATFTLQYADVGQLALNAVYTGAGDESGLVMTGVDSFVAKPDHFALTIPGNPAAVDANGGVFKKAGETFQVEVEARNASGAVTPNYGQESPAESVQLTNSLVAPAGQDNPAMAGSFNSFGSDCGGDPAAGVACGDFSWNEVGIISLLPEVADGDYLGSGNVSGSGSGNVGRFVPERFAVAVNFPAPAFGHGCSAGSFTYLGQEFSFLIDPVLTVTALGNGASVLTNYGGTFWKYPGNLPGRTYTDASGAGTPVSRTTTGATSLAGTGDYDGIGTLIIAGDRLTYTKPGAALAPFAASVDLDIPADDLKDSDGICYDPDADGTCDPYQIAAIGNTEQRYGRLKLQNAYGPETMPLNLPLTAEYHDGSNYVTNVDDSCTGFNAANLTLGNYLGNLASGETTASGVGTLSAGTGAGFGLSAPGVGNDGSVDLTLDLSTATGAAQEWLRSGGAGPTAKATFGIFKGNQHLIYTRESVQ